MWYLEQQIQDLVNRFIEESGAVFVSARDVGLDYRSGHVYVSIDEEFIAVSGSTSSIDYYGGFEYIDHENKKTIGDMTFYSGYDNRVRDCLDYYYENVYQQKEDEKEQQRRDEKNGLYPDKYDDAN